jgi:hypothetical protein
MRMNIKVNVDSVTEVLDDCKNDLSLLKNEIERLANKYPFLDFNFDVDLNKEDFLNRIKLEQIMGLEYSVQLDGIELFNAR